MNENSTKLKKTPSTLSSSIDLSIFENQREPDKKCNDYKTCISINRLLLALKYYTSLKVLNNKA